MNLANYLKDSAARHPEKPAIRFGGTQMTFDELHRRSNRLANGLKTMGLQPGDRCMVMIPNGIDVVTAYYALASLGAITVPVNFLFR